MDLWGVRWLQATYLYRNPKVSGPIGTSPDAANICEALEEIVVPAKKDATVQARPTCRRAGRWRSRVPASAGFTRAVKPKADGCDESRE